MLIKGFVKGAISDSSEAKLQVNDEILEINGKDVQNLPYSTVASIIK